MTTPTIEHAPTVEDYDNRIAALDAQLAEMTTEQDGIEQQIAASWEYPQQTALLQTRYNHVTVLLRGGAIRRGQLVEERAVLAQANELTRFDGLCKDHHDKQKGIEGKQQQIAKLREQINVLAGEISNLEPDLTLARNRMGALYIKLRNSGSASISQQTDEIYKKYQV